MRRVLDFKKGDKCIVAIIQHSNASRHKDMSLNNIDKWTYKGEVITIGRKYITVKFNGIIMKFDPTFDYSEHSNYSADYKLYKDLQEVEDGELKENIVRKIQTEFSGYGEYKGDLTLEQLKIINDIIDSVNKK